MQLNISIVHQLQTLRWNFAIEASETATGWVLKKVALKNFAKFTRKHLCQSLFFNKVAGWKPATLLKKDFGIGVFLWILRNFLEHLFYRTPLENCFRSFEVSLNFTEIYFYVTVTWDKFFFSQPHKNIQIDEFFQLATKKMKVIEQGNVIYSITSYTTAR